MCWARLQDRQEGPHVAGGGARGGSRLTAALRGGGTDVGTTCHMKSHVNKVTWKKTHSLKVTELVSSVTRMMTHKLKSEA